jgi:outer membrane protein assembly factor BamB
MYPRFFLALTAAASALAVGQPRPASPVSDFTFIHCSDIHVPPGVTRKTGPAGGPQFGSAEVVAQIKTLTAPVGLKPYGVTVRAPSFAIATGDLTEFGGLNGWWEQYLQLWQGAPFPVYHESGNHDSTWASQRFQIRRLHGSPYYSFDHGGCHFIGLDSATPQDPRPSFGLEEIEWLKGDLKRLRPGQTVFVFCHHPVDSSEFASLYERDRLLDLLRPYNPILLVGHGHAAQHRIVAGVDQLMGGSTFGRAPGYVVVSLQGGMLRVAYRTAWEEAPALPLLERPIVPKSPYPTVQIAAPAEGATLGSGLLRVRVKLFGASVTGARWSADDEKGREGELRRAGSAWAAEIDTAAWEPGCHYLRVTFQGEEGTTYQRTVRFYTPHAGRVAWRALMGGSAKGSPAVAGELVIAGAGDGLLYAFDRKSGRRRWSFVTGGEILAQPLATREGFYAGSGDGRFYALDHNGKLRWSFDAGHPVYSPAVEAGGKIVVAANNGHIYALDPADGHKLWENADPGYAIESRPFADGGRIYYGAWDGYLYALDLRNGRTLWKTQGAGSAASVPGVARYYSPADAGPVVAGGKVWVADRMYRLSQMDAATGALLGEQKDVASVALSEDRSAVYLRGTAGALRKAGTDGADLWSVPARTSFLPSAPAEKEGIVYSVSATGRVLALDARDGKQLWEYQTTPRLYVFSDPVPSGDMVYVTGMDGCLTALRAR